VRVAVLGLGEAGARYAADLVESGATVSAFDPAPVATPDGVVRCERPADAVDGVDLVLALTAQKDAVLAMETTIDAIPSTSIYADLSTSAPAVKLELASRAAKVDLAFVDVALMRSVPARGLRTPSLVSGTGAGRYVATMGELGVPVESVGDRAGDASTRKLLRSVVMKGLAAVLVEAVGAARAAGLSQWLWRDVTAEITAADEALLTRLLRGSGVHAVRRIDEMEAAVALLESLDVEPVMTRATVDRLRRAASLGVPDVPDGPRP
jgi:3-hydroxyisobutyrate dehydrogenase-like beta-hydroxyacid dehydrogenase